MISKRWWKWWVAGLLLLASTINYMDRQTLSNVAVRITQEFSLSEEQYGNIELSFGLAFAAGSLLFGWAVDRTNLRWLYPSVLLAWSVMGFLTGFAASYAALLLFRAFLGVFEAGHWPCALKTTQRLLPPEDRTLGNSLLTSGLSIGAIVTPLIMTALLTDDLGSWRFPFQLIGGIGAVWVVLWLATIRSSDLRDDPRTTTPEPATSVWTVILTPKFLSLMILVMCINSTWHLFRVWLVKFLIQGRGYEESFALYANSAFYVASDLGCLAAGAVSLFLFRRLGNVHRARTWTFLGAALLTSSSLAVLVLGPGWPLLAILMVAGFGSLALFPCYYSFAQDLSVEHVGKVTGILAAFAWIAASPVHKFFGRLVDQTGSFDLGFALAGCLPFIGWLALKALWPVQEHSAAPVIVKAHV